MEIRFNNHPVFGEFLTDDVFGNLFDSFSQNRETTAPVDINETNEQYEIIVEVPGFTREDLKVSVDQNVLSIQGKRVKQATEGKKRIVAEIGRGDVSRKFRLPAAVNLDGITTEFANGLLRIVIPKQAQARVKDIPIN